ncbi:MAG: chemoreceptor glutamine deamidase CheD [Gammaproteobacteria bacterium]
MRARNPSVFYDCLPEALPGFEKITRYWDDKYDTYAAKIVQGEYYVTMYSEMITTVLGSCVSACIRDKKLGIGGMNHFMLPVDNTYDHSSWRDSPVDTAARYGNVAMERLINAIQSHGGRRENLEIKVFGGSRLLNITMDIGKDNIDFVRHYLRTEKLEINAEDLGGEYPRKIMYFPATGRAMVKKLMRMHNETILQRESRYFEILKTVPVEGEIEIFSK